MLYDLANPRKRFDVPLSTDWFHDKTDAKIKALTVRGFDLDNTYHYISKFFDAHVLDPHRNPVCVPLNCPHNWPPDLEAVWKGAGEDQELAAMFLGCLFCRCAIEREDVWLTTHLPLPNRVDPRKWKPRQYFLAPDFLGKPRRRV